MVFSWFAHPIRTFKSLHPRTRAEPPSAPDTINVPCIRPPHVRELLEAHLDERSDLPRPYNDLPLSMKTQVLDRGERWWRDHHDLLEEAGYRLRLRYHPNWQPTWQFTDRRYEDCEDGAPANPFWPIVIDAERIEDNLPVFLKRVQKPDPTERETTASLTTGFASADPQNHCMPIHTSLRFPHLGFEILVFARFRQWDNPNFETIGEAVNFFEQIFEGLAFLHRQGLAHRDPHQLNIMMDARPMYPDGWHPIKTDRLSVGAKIAQVARHLTRSQRPPRYYFIDFGLSEYHDRTTGSCVTDLRFGGDHSCPEEAGTGLFDPFPVDVYYLGNVLREHFVENKKGFEFIGTLINDMTNPDPQRRPTMNEVVKHFQSIKASLSRRKLRSRVIQWKPMQYAEHRFKPVTKRVYWRHWVHDLLNGTPVVPVPTTH